MYKLRISRLPLAVLCALPLFAGAQDGLQLRTQPTLTLLPPDTQEDAPLYIEADKIQGHSEKETEAEGNVRLRKPGKAFFADWMRYDKDEDLLNAVGHVRIEQGGDTVTGERLRYELSTDRGEMDKPVYHLRARDATPTPAPAAPRGPTFGGLDGRGDAARILFRGPGEYRAQQGAYTTCGPGNDDWFIRARELDIDRNRDVGVARDARIVFFDQTIFYTPYMSFSLHQERKSGFLPPHYGSTNTTGVELTVPYYWNIAPNMDATFYPRYMTKRGVQLGTEFRYLDPSYQGIWRAELLPNDQQLSRDRYGVFLKHTQTFANGWAANLNYNHVSDGTYFLDLSTIVAVTSQTLLSRDLTLSRGGGWGNGGSYAFYAVAQGWQALQSDPLLPVTPPYSRLPQLTLTAFQQNVARTDFDFLSTYTEFYHPTAVNGRRFVAYPSFSLPLETSYAYVTPKLGMHVTRYVIGRNNTGFEDRNRALPIFTTDSGVVFERDARLGGMAFTQTLEPKLYYVYVPFRDQSQLPNFESGVQDINFATIFSENQFSGHDRINDANQITLGMISRLIHPDTGVERVRVGVAQRYYFQAQRVTVPGVPPRSSQSSKSDLLAMVSGTVAPHVTTEAGWQYNTDLRETQKFNVAARYQPAPGKVLNLAYRNTVDLIRQSDVSFQWPIPFASKWSAVGRWNYSMRDKRMLEGLAGLEYDAGCWVFRVVAHRFALATQAASTSIFLQLELNGVSRIGSNPLETLRRNIGGYTQYDPRIARPQDGYVPQP